VTELISVIVTTYNREDALDAVLRGLSRQTDRDYEIIIADDGSKPPTAQAVQAWSERIGVALGRVWHEDRGFRAAEIRNRAIAASRGSYCIFLDGDCIPRPDFVATHRRLAEPGWFVTGNRLLLSHDLTATRSERKPNGDLPAARGATHGSEIREVHARDEENQRDRSTQSEERRSHVSHDLRLE